MGCCSNFNDKYLECEFLIEEYKLIVIQLSINNYTENELKAIEIFKNEKELKITAFINELEKNSIDELQKRKIIKLKNDFNEIINEEDISESNSKE